MIVKSRIRNINLVRDIFIVRARSCFHFKRCEYSGCFSNHPTA